MGPWVGATVNTCITLGMRTFQQVPQNAPEPLLQPRHIEVQVVSMERLLAGLNWAPSIDLMKIDCEGCEWSVLGINKTDQANPVRLWHSTFLVGELHFGCGQKACWPSQGANSTENCS